MDHIDFEAVGWGIEQLLFFFTQNFFMTKWFFFLFVSSCGIFLSSAKVLQVFLVFAQP